MDNKPLTDEELGVIVDQKSAEAVGWFNSKLSIEREKVIQYYNAELPKQKSTGSSPFISTDVYDAVEGMKAQLLETFASGTQLVKFDPETAEDAVAAEIETNYTDYVIHRQNPSYQLFSHWIDDGLKARVGVLKVWWDECTEYVDHEFDDLEEQEATALASKEDVHSMDAQETHEGSGRYKGKLTRKVDKSQVRYEVINPEEFSIEPQAKELGSDYFCVQRSVKTIDELCRQGYDKDKLDNWNANEDMALKSNPEVLARFQQIDSGVAASNTAPNDEMRRVLITEAYIKCCRKGDDYAKLYKVVRLGSETLDTEEVEDLPFIAFTPLPIPHSFYGNNFAARVIPTQNSRTSLMRSILDHAAITTNPRLQVLKGGVVNPKELLDNRLGGIVNTTRPDAVKALEQAQLNPFVFQTMEVIKQHNEESTGLSSLSQGLNKDALSKQNSEGLVDKLTSLSQVRQKGIARNFAYNSLVPLYLKVRNLILTKEKRQKIIEVTGQFQQVDVRRWKENRACSVSIHLGYGEMDREANTLMGLGSMIAKDPQLNSMFQAQGRFKMAKDVFEKKGVANVLDYLTPPDKIPPQKPDPMKVKEMELEERKIAAQEMVAKAAADKVQARVQIEAMREKLDAMQHQFDNMMKQRDEDRKDSDVANKIDVAQREIAIVEKTPMTSGVASASPR